jgi:hypothetical protein
MNGTSKHDIVPNVVLVHVLEGSVAVGLVSIPLTLVSILLIMLEDFHTWSVLNGSTRSPNQLLILTRENTI